MKTTKRLFAAVAFSVVALFGAQTASAADLGTGNVITLTDSYGSTAGGEFLVSVVTGPSIASFATFCLETTETFSPGQNLYVKSVTDSAMNGGAFGGPIDPISSQTAYLYTQFRAGTLSNYDFASTGSPRVADANSLQRAFWALEENVATTDSQALTWIQEANNAITNNQWSGIGNVRVLNLYKDANYSQLAQDQLYLITPTPVVTTPVPEPEIYAMMAAGLGLMGFVARRRKQNGTV